MATFFSILPRESYGQRSWVGYSPWSHKDLDMTERLMLSLLTLTVLAVGVAAELGCDGAGCQFANGNQEF